MGRLKNENEIINSMRCPDCSAEKMPKLGNFYTCERCGLSFKPWEVEAARKRARDEINALRPTTDEDKAAKKRKDRINYRNWLEGKSDID